MSSRCRARTCRCRSSARTSPACALVSVASSILRTCSSRSASRASRKRSLSSAAALARCVPRGGELGLEELLAEGTNLAEGRVDVASRVGGVGGPGVLLEVGELEFSPVGSLGGFLHGGVRVREELLAPRGTLAKVVERALPLLGIRGVDAPRERSLRAGRVQPLAPACKFLASSRKPNSLESLHLPAAGGAGGSRRAARSASASATCFSCLSCAVDDLRPDVVLVGASERGGGVGSSFHLADGGAERGELRVARGVGRRALAELSLRLGAGVLKP